MASNQNPKKYLMSEIKTKLLRPSLTSTYAVYFNASELLEKKSAADGSSIKQFFGNRQALVDPELLTLSCSEASLPGSSLATNEINNDYTGVTERYAYRRLYDDRADFTFYVDHDYTIVKFFETWISWIVGETQYTEQSKQTFNYRVKFPNDYNVNMHIQKFEKDYNRKIEYTFIGAYPISITSMPVSYDSSQLLKCTVAFTYKRYYLENSSQLTSQDEEPSQPITQELTLYGPRPTDVPQTVEVDVNRPTLGQLYPY